MRFINDTSPLDDSAELGLYPKNLQETWEKSIAMTPEKIQRSISMLTGEVHALFLFAQMMAKLNPDRSAVLAYLEKIEQLGLVSIGPSIESSATTDGFRFVIDGIRKSLKSQAGTP